MKRRQKLVAAEGVSKTELVRRSRQRMDRKERRATMVRSGFNPDDPADVKRWIDAKRDNL